MIVVMKMGAPEAEIERVDQELSRMGSNSGKDCG
jgi:hypothetical protein